MSENMIQYFTYGMTRARSMQAAGRADGTVVPVTVYSLDNHWRRAYRCPGPGPTSRRQLAMTDAGLVHGRQ